MNNIESARIKYKPEEIKILFVAEAPPENTSRFFYFEDVDTHDALFVNLMRLLYPDVRDENGGSVGMIRSTKEDLLRRFQNDGYHLIDALPEPISLAIPPRKRVKLIKARKNKVADEIESLIAPGSHNPETSHVGIVLIKTSVFNALDHYLLVDRRLPVINRNVKIPFPTQGHQRRFMDTMHECLAPFDQGYRARTKFVSYSGDIEITSSEE